MELSAQFYARALDIAERLAEDDLTNIEAQRDLSISYHNLGDVQLQLGDTESALEFYQQCSDILARLAAADPLNSPGAAGSVGLVRPAGERAAAVG